MFSRISFLCLFSIMMLFSTCVQAQNQNTFTGWGATFLTYKFDPKFSFHFDGQVRSTDEWKDMQSYIIRPGINYHINNNMIATVGYAYVGNRRSLIDINGWIPEHRIWEQFIVNQKFTLAGRSITLQHRIRLEQRFMGQPKVDQNELVNDRYDFAQRLRYFTRAIVPLAEASSFNDGTFIALQNEVFANVQNAPNGRFFDQNRAYLAVGYRVNPKFDIETGYMNQYVKGKNNNTANNIIQLAAYVRL